MHHFTLWTMDVFLYWIPMCPFWIVCGLRKDVSIWTIRIAQWMICLCVFFSFHFSLLKHFSLKNRRCLLELKSICRNSECTSIYIYVYFSFFPFLLDMCDFDRGEAFLHKSVHFPDLLVQSFTAVFLSFSLWIVAKWQVILLHYSTMFFTRILMYNVFAFSFVRIRL